MSTAIQAIEPPTAEELSVALKEVISIPLSNDDVKVEIEVKEYDLVDGHIANIGGDIKIDSTFIKLNAGIKARHPKLGSLPGPFQDMDKSTVLLCRCKVDLGSIQNTMIPITIGAWETYLNGLEEVKLELNQAIKEAGVSFEARIINQNQEGLIDEFAICLNVHDSSTGQLASSYELNVNLAKPYTVISITGKDLTMGSRVFDDNEQQMITLFENIKQREPATIIYSQSMIELIKSYLKMLSVQGPAMMQNGFLGKIGHPPKAK